MKGTKTFATLNQKPREQGLYETKSNVLIGLSIKSREWCFFACEKDILDSPIKASKIMREIRGIFYR